MNLDVKCFLMLVYTAGPVYSKQEGESVALAWLKESDL